MSALRGRRPNIGRDAYGGVPAAHRPIRHQRIAIARRCHLRRPGSQRHHVLAVAVEGGNAGHQRVPRVKATQCKCGRNRVRRVVIRVIVPAHPAAVHSVGLAGPVEATAILNYDPTPIHVVSQVVTKRSRILELRKTERYHDVVLLELGQSGRTGVCVEQVNYRDPWLGLYLRLQLGRHAGGIGIGDQHPERNRRARGRSRW